MGVVSDVQAYLGAEGLVDGTTAWPSVRRRLHDEAGDRLVVLTEDGGVTGGRDAPSGLGSDALARPGFQVLVRGAPWDSDSALEQAIALRGALDSVIDRELAEQHYLTIRARTPEPVFTGFDDQGRPQFTTSFLALTSPNRTYWSERFEGGQYDMLWGSEDIQGGVTVDPNASPPAAASGWGSSCMRVDLASGASTRHGQVSHTLRRGRRRVRASVDLIVATDGLSDGAVLVVAFWNRLPTGTLCNLFLQKESGALLLRAQLAHGGGTELIDMPIVEDTLYTFELFWDIDAEAWSVKLNDVVQDSGLITGTALSDAWAVARLSCGLSSVGADSGDTGVFYFDNYVLAPVVS